VNGSEQHIPYDDLGRVNEPFRDQLLQKFNLVLEKGRFVLGKEVALFENAFGHFCDECYCAGVANGYDALVLSLLAFSFPQGKEVLVPSNTYIATINAVINAGLKPVLVEPDIRTYNIALERIEESVTEHTVAIIPVHLYGRCCDMDKICEFAAQHRLKIIEDCAQSAGAVFLGRKAGTFGDCSAFSFYPTKNLGALGDGGAVISKDADFIDRIKMLRNYGSTKKYYNDLCGVNSRLDELQAAFLNVKLPSLEVTNGYKMKLATIYDARLSNSFIKPQTAPSGSHVYHIYNVRHKRRDELREHLLQHKITTEIHYPVPPHRQRSLQQYFPRMNYPLSEEIHNTTLSLPISTCHSEQDIMRVIDALNNFQLAV
jgi:dTDP-4-amino-4,6-dideoxygalactose transaminase